MDWITKRQQYRRSSTCTGTWSSAERRRLEAVTLNLKHQTLLLIIYFAFRWRRCVHVRRHLLTCNMGTTCGYMARCHVHIVMIGDCTRSANTGPGEWQGAGEGVWRPSPDGDWGQGRSPDSSPGVYLDIYTGYLLFGIYLDIYTVYLLPGIYLDIYTVYLLRVSTALGFKKILSPGWWLDGT